MTLNAHERQTTSEELLANLALTGLTREEVASDLGLTLRRLEAALTLDGRSDPADAWLVRDYLHQAVIDAGRTPQPFTVLTEQSRAMAQVWFRLHPAPRHSFTG